MSGVGGPRVVSLVPSVTETLLAWGVTPVACTRFCLQPEIAHVGGTKDPDLPAIIGLQPDLVVLCEEENLLADYEALVAAGLACHALRIDGVDDVLPQLSGLAAALDLTGVDAGGVEGASDAPTVRRRAFVPVWRRPWMTMSAGTYGASLLASIGVDTLFADDPRRYPEVSLEEVAAAGPDVVLLPTEPYPFAERHVGEFAEIAPAVLVDGQDLFWWGVRTPHARSRLAASLATL